LVYVVDDGTSGVLVDGWDPADYADAALRLIDDPELRAKMGKAATDWAKRFSWEDTVKRYLELYRGVLSPGS
jgi:D-inositol-3-phosphate glycosyltransferase